MAPRDMRPPHREPEAEDSDSDTGMPGLIDGPLDSGNARHMAAIWPEPAAGPPRRVFSGPTLANAELQARHDREYRTLHNQEAVQSAIRSVFHRRNIPTNGLRMVRRPRPPARLVFQGNVERHFDEEVAAWHAAANEPDSPRTQERTLRWAFIEAANALERFRERPADAPEAMTEGDAPAIIAEVANSEHGSDGDSQAAASAAVGLNVFGETPDESDNFIIRHLALDEIRQHAQSADEIARPGHRRGYASPVGTERLGRYSNGTVTPSDDYGYNPIWCERTGLPRLGFSYSHFDGSAPILPDGHHDLCDASDELPTIPSWLGEHTQATIVCYAPTDYECEESLHFIDLSGATADPERAAVERLIQHEASNTWSSWRRGYMPEGADLEDVLFRRGQHPLRSNAHPDPQYVPGKPRSVPSTAQPAPPAAEQPREPPDFGHHRVDQESDVEVDVTSSDTAYDSDQHDCYMLDYHETHPDDSD